MNIVDTPGHSDFGGEVERILDMVDGAILLVDASEGPLPQTRFVLKKALEKNLKLVVCINKIDRPDARADEVINEIFDLFIDLEANEDQADFDVIYAIAKDGVARTEIDGPETDFKVLFEWITNNFPAPDAQPDEPLSLLVSNIDYDDYVGRLAIGRIRSGVIKVGDELTQHTEEGKKRLKVSALFGFESSSKVKVPELKAGDIGVIAGFEHVNIGDSVTAPDQEPLTRIRVDEPTVGVLLSVNDSPFSGLEGSQVTSRKIKERLEKELLHNVALRVEPTSTPETFKVVGRGELQLSILFEQMRREGFEMLISKPMVEVQMMDGEKKEPMEIAVVDVDETYVGAVTQKLGERKGVLINMTNKGYGRARGGVPHSVAWTDWLPFRVFDRHPWYRTAEHLL